MYIEHSSQVDMDVRYQDPYGNLRGTAALVWPSDKGFVGGTNDPSGLTHIGAREYDPALGRFISDDPITDFNQPQQINGYAYANNTPITKSDPTGLYVPEGTDGQKGRRAFSDGHGGYSSYNDRGQSYRNDGNGNYVPVPQPKYVPSEDFLRTYGLEYLSQSGSLVDAATGMSIELSKQMARDLKELEKAWLAQDDALFKKYGMRLKNAGLEFGPSGGIGWGRMGTFSTVQKIAKAAPWIAGAISIGVAAYDVVVDGKPAGKTIGSAAGEIAGGIAGAKMGVTIGMWFGPVGAGVGFGVGAVVGAIAGSWGGGILGEWADDWFGW